MERHYLIREWSHERLDQQRSASLASDHMLVVHPDGSPCLDGCEDIPDPEALRRYVREAK